VQTRKKCCRYSRVLLRDSGTLYFFWLEQRVVAKPRNEIPPKPPVLRAPHIFHEMCFHPKEASYFREMSTKRELPHIFTKVYRQPKLAHIITMLVLSKIWGNNRELKCLRKERQRIPCQKALRPQIVHTYKNTSYPRSMVPPSKLRILPQEPDHNISHVIPPEIFIFVFFHAILQKFPFFAGCPPNSTPKTHKNTPKK